MAAPLAARPVYVLIVKPLSMQQGERSFYFSSPDEMHAVGKQMERLFFCKCSYTKFNVCDNLLSEPAECARDIGKHMEIRSKEL